VTVPELGTMSITVALAPRVRGGLYALLRVHLTSGSAQSPTKNGTSVTNLVTGNVAGDAIQVAGDVHGGINISNKPRRRR
jgi:hypothetical protein